jgi:hypothetical protein
MKRIAILGTLGALALAGSAQAGPQYSPTPPQHGAHHCQPHNVGYNAYGTLIGSSLTPAGQGRYNGTIEVDVAKVNHRAATGDQTFTLTATRVKFHHGVDATAPAAGSRVRLHGKITKLSKHCSSEGFTPTIAIKRVDVRQPKQ